MVGEPRPRQEAEGCVAGKGNLQYAIPSCCPEHYQNAAHHRHTNLWSHAEVYDEYGDFDIVNRRFTADRKRRILTMVDFDGSGVEQSVALDGGKMSKLLRWIVHSLEVFMWAQDYGLSDDDIDDEPEFDPLLDIDIDFDFEDADEDDLDDTDSEPEQEQKETEDIPYWRVQIKYSNGTEQDIANYSFDYLSDKPEELYDALWEYFAPDEPDDWDEPEDF